MINESRKEAQQELAKFFQLTAENPDEMLMPRCLVDHAWHELMEDADRYETFCMESVGMREIGHNPGGGYAKIRWVERYEEKHGKLNKVWFTSEDGSFNQSAYEEYLNSGELIASWDCGPVIPEIVNRINKDIDNLGKIKEINKKIDDLVGIIPDLDKIERIDEDAIVDSIKEKVDKFKIDKIKERHNIN